MPLDCLLLASFYLLLTSCYLLLSSYYLLVSSNKYTIRTLHYLSCDWMAGWPAGWVGVDTEINAKPAQAKAKVGAELGKNE